MRLNVQTASNFEPYHKGGTAREIRRNRPFMAWDGEGVTPADSVQQNYVLFGNSAHEYIVSDGSHLPTHTLLDFMLNAGQRHDCIHVSFAFGYDVEMILGTMPEQLVYALHKNGTTLYNGIRIEYRKGKFFRVSDGSRSIRIWDLWGFFQSSFIKALEDNLPNDPTTADILAGKNRRKTFAMHEMQTLILPYWKMEITALAALAEKLRTNLYNAGLTISQWQGPGAVAGFLYQRNGIKRHKAETPPNVCQASQFAYAAGRFEMFKLGRANQRVYGYDIRSAYPAAITQLPSLTDGGEWVHTTEPTHIADFGVYHIEFSNPNLYLPPMPLFYRDANSNIHFPNRVTGWYWTPEARLAIHMGGRLLESWDYVGGTATPFTWVQDLYNERRRMKAEGNASQMALKLGINSLYGKMAQRVGHKDGKAPAWHQLEWAGYVTSHVRAKLFRAMMLAGKHLVAVETDGIYSTVPLALDIGESLGQWESKEYDDIVYLQSGFYFAKDGGTWKAKTRGFDKGSISYDAVMRTLDNPVEQLYGMQTRFASMGQWLPAKNRETKRRVWTTTRRELELGASGKRIHRKSMCNACAAGIRASECFHDMTITSPMGGVSKPHILPWVESPEWSINPWHNLADQESTITPEGRNAQ